jgi:hypothetical protein
MRGRWRFSLSSRAARTRRSGLGIATIEIAAVLAATLVMVTLAVSAYRTHSVRREVRATLTAVTPLQSLVTAAFERSGVPPISELDVPALEPAALRHRYLEAVTIAHGRIQLRFGGDADDDLRGRSLSVSPYETMDGKISWLCGTRAPGVGLYPLGFFGGTMPPGELLSTVERRYLPPECR